MLGKTTFGKAIATELEFSFLCITSADINTKWRGVAEQKIRAAFKVARENVPCVMFFDEVESLLRARSDDGGGPDTVQEFLAQTDGVDDTTDNTWVIWIGATNLPWMIDSAVARRFGSKLLIDLPNEPTRADIFLHGLLRLKETVRMDISDTPGGANEVHLRVAERTNFFSPSDMSMLLNDIRDKRWDVCDSAMYFKKVYARDPSTGLHDKTKIRWTPCNESSRGAKRMTIADININEIELPAISWSMIDKCLVQRKPTISSNGTDKKEQKQKSCE